MNRRGVIIHPEEASPRWLRLLKQSELNVLGIHPVGGPLADQTLDAFIHRYSTPEFQSFRNAVLDLGCDFEFELHALTYLMPRSLFGAHPDWFRVDLEGKRNPDFNLCFSNADAVGYIKKAAEKLARTLVPTSGRYYLWLDDVFYADSFCHCEKCRQLNAADQQLIAVNAMADAIRQFNPEAQIAHIAYLDAIVVPQVVKPAEGVFLEYAPYRRTYDYAINDPACEMNVKESASLPGLIEYFGAKNAQVLEYWVDNSFFSKWTKPPVKLPFKPEQMKLEVAFYRSLGFESMTSFACYLGEDYVELYGEPPVQLYGQILKEGMQGLA